MSDCTEKRVLLGGVGSCRPSVLADENYSQYNRALTAGIDGGHCRPSLSARVSLRWADRWIRFLPWGFSILK